MQGLFVTVARRGLQHMVPAGREPGEIKTMLTAYTWNLAVAALSSAVISASGAAEVDSDVAGTSAARRLTKTLQSTNLLLSKTI